MSVYVDTPKHRFGRMIMCHMMADSENELHTMADRIGIKRCWFQGPPDHHIPHYDICKAKRALALKCGAVEEDTSAFIQRFRLG